jgi:hypothetical protein
MSEIPLIESYYVDLLSRYFKYLLFFATLLGYFFAYLIGRLDPPLLIDSLLIVIPIIGAILLLNPDYVKSNPDIDQKIPYFNFETSKILKIFFILYFISIIILQLFQTRPWFYFVIMTILFILIFIQILNNKKNRNAILFQNLLLSLNFTYGITLKYPYYFGMTDYFTHIYYAEYIQIVGNTIPKIIDIGYANFPLYHILMAISSLFFLIDVRTTTFLVTGFIFSLTILFVFQFFYITTGNLTRTLLITMIYSSLSPVIFSGHYMVTRCMAYVGFIILIYLLFKMFSLRKNSNIYKILLIIFSLFILTVHQVSLPQFILLLSILLICILLTTYEIKGHLFLIFLILILLSYWIYTANEFFTLIVETRTYSSYYESIILNSAGSNVISSNVLIDSLQYICENFYHSVFIFFALFGIGMILMLKKDTYAIIFALFAFITMFLFIPTPLNNLWVFEWLFRADRFKLFISPFMAFVMGFGIYYFLNFVNQNQKKNYLLFLIIFLLGISIFSSISATLNSSDSIDLHGNVIPTYFEKIDLQTLDFIHGYIKNNSTIFSDEPVKLYLAPMNCFDSIETYNMKCYNAPGITTLNIIQNFEGFFLYRQGLFTKAQSLHFYNMNYKYTYANKKYLEYQLDRYNKIFSNRANIIYS